MLVKCLKTKQGQTEFDRVPTLVFRPKIFKIWETQTKIRKTHSEETKIKTKHFFLEKAFLGICVIL
jgi:hypothetical protein